MPSNSVASLGRGRVLRRLGAWGLGAAFFVLACGERRVADPIIAVCGDGVTQTGRGETCDPPSSCPTTCEPLDACTPRTLTGAADACNAACVDEPIASCEDSDGCCPSACNHTTDDDCEDPCAAVTTCDGVSGDGCCPGTCDHTTDNDCADPCAGVAACDLTAADGCCPNGCDLNTDTDCTTECTGSGCGPADGCCVAGCDEATDEDCTPQCDNGVVETGELCDPLTTCPTECPTTNPCQPQTLIGDGASCTAACRATEVTACANSDGCCPAGCDPSDDDDCPCAAVSACVEDDGCCPPSCHAGVDNDCVPDCDRLDAWPPQWTALEDELLTAINQARARGADCGAVSYAGGATASVAPSDVLRKLARCHSLDQANNDLYGHGSTAQSPHVRCCAPTQECTVECAAGECPDGVTCTSAFIERLTHVGYSGLVWELVARIGAAPDQVVSDWETLGTTDDPDALANCNVLMMVDVLDNEGNPAAQMSDIGLGYAENPALNPPRRWTAVFGAPR